MLAAAFDSTDTGMLIHDGQKTILMFNNAMAEITGVPVDEAIGRDCRSFFDPVFCDRRCTLCKEAESNPSGSFDQEAQAINRNGVSYWFRINCFPFTHGRRKYFLITLSDITEMKRITDQAGRSNSFFGIIGRSDAVRDVFEFARSVSESDLTVLITGETGVGKELVASAIREGSLRKNGPFIKVNCAALPEHLVESELFGHVRGAFTGASTGRIGRFEAASGGTIFLDEIGEISLQMQAKLLRALQEREIERLGEHRPRKVDIRIIAATNKDLAKEAREGRFREDLYFRLAAGVVHMPSLRERREDIPLLASHFLTRFSSQYNRGILGISAELMTAIMNHDWPGNVRELHNAIEAAVVMCKGGLLTMDNISAGYFKRSCPTQAETAAETGRLHTLPERERIMAALEANRHNVSKAAKALGMSRVTLWRKRKALGLDNPYTQD